jgi:hypothetical protein
MQSSERKIYNNTTTDDTDGYASMLFNHLVYQDNAENYDLTDLFLFVEELVARALAHFGTGGSVHVSISVDDPETVILQSYTDPITDYGTALTTVRVLKYCYDIHAANTAAHGTADTTSFASLGDPPYYGDIEGLYTYVNACKAAFNTHLANTPFVHASADALNPVVSADVSPSLFRKSAFNATLRVIGFCDSLEESFIFESKFGFWMDEVGDLHFSDIMDPDQIVANKYSSGASTWVCDINTSGQNLVVTVTGDGNPISWSGNIIYDQLLIN